MDDRVRLTGRGEAGEERNRAEGERAAGGASPARAAGAGPEPILFAWHDDGKLYREAPAYWPSVTEIAIELLRQAEAQPGLCRVGNTLYIEVANGRAKYYIGSNSERRALAEGGAVGLYLINEQEGE